MLSIIGSSRHPAPSKFLFYEFMEKRNINLGFYQGEFYVLACIKTFNQRKIINIWKKTVIVKKLPPELISLEKHDSQTNNFLENNSSFWEK